MNARSLALTVLLAAGAISLAPSPVHADARRPGLCATVDSKQSAPPYLAVVSAYPAELAPIAAATEIDTTIQIASRTFYLGRLGGVSVMLGLTGIGILNATNVTHALLARRDVAGLIMSGTAGTRHHIGDVVIASELVEPDRPEVFHPNPALVALARQAAVALPEPLARCTLVPPGSPTAQEVCLLFDPVVIFGGRAVSFDPFGDTPPTCAPGGGDIFGCDLPAANGALLHPRTITTDDVEDMESAAVARVAADRRVPFLAVRAGSDGGGDPHGDRGFPAQFFDYYRLAAHNAADVTRAVVLELGRLVRDRSAKRTCRLLAGRRWQRAAKRIDERRPG